MFAPKPEELLGLFGEVEETQAGKKKRG